MSALGRFDGPMVMVYSAGSLLHVRRCAGVRPEVRWRPVRPGGTAAMSAPSLLAGVFALAGRLPQWGQQVSAVTAARARDSTAVKTISPGVIPVRAAARAARPAIRLWASRRAQAS